MPRATDVNVSAAVVGGALGGWWALTLSIVAGVLLGGHAREHEALELSIGIVESGIGEVDAAVEDVESALGQVGSDVGEVKSAVASIASSVARVESSIRDVASAISEIEQNAGATPGSTEMVIGEMNLQVIAPNSLAEPGGNRVSNSNEEPGPETYALADAVGRIEFGTDNHVIGDEQQRDVKRVFDNIQERDQERDTTGDILVLGFADSCGPPAGNLNLSELRAESVAAALLDLLGRRTIHVFGMGESVGAFGNGLCDSQRQRSVRVFLFAPDGEDD